MAVILRKVRILANNNARVVREHSEVASVVQIKYKFDARAKGITIELVSIILENHIIFDDFIDAKVGVYLITHLIALEKCS